MDAAREFIKRHEGLVLKAYKCSRGYWTWAYGCRIKDDLMRAALDAGTEFALTQAQADALLTAALWQATEDAATLFPDLRTFSEWRQVALISLTFQLGFGGLQRFHEFCLAVRRGDWTRAAAELAFKNGLTKSQPSDYAMQCPERCAETARLLLDTASL